MSKHVVGWIVSGCIAIAGLLPAEAARKKPRGEPDRVTVQHVLIGYKGTVRGKEIDRTRREAAALANELLERAQNGEDFDALVKQYTDDSHPGIYSMSNFGVQKQGKEIERENMVVSFGDVAFELAVGEIGMAKHHAAKSRYGWHIIKRLE